MAHPGKPTLLLLVLSCTALSIAQTTAHVDQPITSPIFVNLYWDINWDADDPGMKKASLDGITQAIINSSYFRGLAEYGVTSASFAGGFLPEPACPSKAPASVGFYDPINTSIAGFVQCEHDIGPPILRQNSVIYNVILPPYSMESDFWSANFCNGPNSPAGWHYHGLEDNFPNIFGGPPVYTIVLSNPKCGGNPSLVALLTHEMVEATTDPSPIDISIVPPHGNVASENEIGDLCENSSVPFKPIFVDGSGQTPLIAPITVSTYWSNAMQSCGALSDTTAPAVSNVSISNWGSQTQVTVSGSGLGAMPGQVSLPSPVLPYLEVVDSAHAWAAGDAINGDIAEVNIPAWTDSQVSNAGLIANGIAVNTLPSVPLVVWLCNPNSLMCVSHGATSAPGPYNPRLLIFNIVAGDFLGAPDTISVLVNSKLVMKNTVSGNCSSACVFSSLQTLNPGSYAISQQVSGNSPVKTVFNSCTQISLSLGEETSCRISDSGPSDPTGGCQPGYKCCEPGVDKCKKCISGRNQCP